VELERLRAVEEVARRLVRVIDFEFRAVGRLQYQWVDDLISQARALGAI